jgi:hypothetical protein
MLTRPAAVPRQRSAAGSRGRGSRAASLAASVQLEGSGEALGGDRSAAVVAAGVLAAGTLEQIAHHPLIGRRRQSGLPVKEPDRRRPRAQGLGRGSALAQVAQEGRDEGRVRAQGLEAEALSVGGELPPASVVGPAGVLGGRAGDEYGAVVMARATCGEADGGTSIMRSGLLPAGE